MEEPRVLRVMGLYPRPTLKLEGEGHSPEEPRVLHVLCVIVIGLLCTNAYPEEVLWLLAFIDDL